MPPEFNADLEAVLARVPAYNAAILVDPDERTRLQEVDIEGLLLSARDLVVKIESGMDVPDRDELDVPQPVRSQRVEAAVAQMHGLSITAQQLGYQIDLAEQ